MLFRSSIVKGIVEAHHGQIKVTSQQGHGSSFMITLPQKQENLSAEEEENQAVIESLQPNAIDQTEALEKQFEVSTSRRYYKS